MNNPSPLIPQGSNIDQKNKGRARFKIAFFFVLAIHGIGLMALLMQGCRREEPAPQPFSDTNAPVVDTLPFEPTNQPSIDTNLASLPVLPDTNAMVPSIPDTSLPPTQVSEMAPTMQQYKVAKGDTFSTIASKFKVSSSAIQKANPGVEPTKLQINQVLNIPAPTTETSPFAPGTVDAATPKAYKVQSGDTLTKIASRFGTTVKAIRALNGLKTDNIRVGQTLKIPVKTAPTANPVAPTLPTPTIDTAPTESPTLPPGQ
jgi:LysM repeat protein